MAYKRERWKFNNSIENEFKWQGNYGAKGEKRAPKKKATHEQVKKQNQYMKQKNMRRLIKANFNENDYWITLKYPKGERPGIETVKKDLKKFIDTMRQQYKKKGNTFKYIYRMEVGKRGGIHIHMILNTSGRTDKLIRKCWPYGVNFELLREQDDVDQLASYITKLPEDDNQLSMFDLLDRKQFIKYSSSRNLIRPEPEKRTYGHWTMRKIIEEGPKPAAGFYIDKNSIRYGVNPYTGMSYLYYTEIKIPENEYKKIKEGKNDSQDLSLLKYKRATKERWSNWLYTGDGNTERCCNTI